MTMTARGLAEARHLLLTDLESARSWPVTPDMPTGAVGAWMASGPDDVAALAAADLFAVAPDACVLAGAAAPDLPATYRPAPADIPARAGLMVWESPVLTVPDQTDGGRPLDVSAAFWRFVIGRTGQAGVGFHLYSATPSVRPLSTWRSPLVPVRYGSLALGDGTPADPWSIPDPDADRGLRFLLSTWLLMAQGATDEAAAPVSPDRTRLARTLAKRGRPLAAVRVVDLHRAAAGSAASSGRTVSVRYAVRGHWRNQAYGPARTLRRPVWVHPHVRGPEDAPWSGGTTVARLRAPADEAPPPPSTPTT
ncbi:hypothetical protein ABZ644_25670 [Nocardiopsis alba]|uniref:hypothetical protein n=1 Tax=Nocardiopsis alba TaxID=53437 RepID=UPI0033FDB6DA